MKSYTVFIEQPFCKGTEIQARNIEEALEKAREMYMREEIVFTADDTGTDAQIMAKEVGGGEETEWKDL